MLHVDDFFIPTNAIENIPEEEYEKITPLVSTLDSLTRVLYQSIYVIDYYKKNFLYVSDNPLFLCGLQPHEVKKKGYSFYFEYVPEEEVRMLLEINHAGFDLFQKTPVDNRIQLSISYDFHICDAKQKILINHKLTPILLATNGNIWLAACVVSLSSQKEAGNIEARIAGQLDYWSYSMERRQWERKNNVTLSQRDKNILSLSARGFTMDEIAEKLLFSVSTIKSDKQKLFEKLGVTNISEALSIASTNKMI